MPRLSMNPGAISDHVSAAVPYLFHAFHGHGSGNRPKYALKIGADHAFVLGIYGRCVHLIHFSVGAGHDIGRMRLSNWRFVFEVNETWRNEDKGQDQGDHYVVMEASPRVRPEQVALECAPNARHKLSV